MDQAQPCVKYRKILRVADKKRRSAGGCLYQCYTVHKPIIYIRDCTELYFGRIAALVTDVR